MSGLVLSLPGASLVALWVAPRLLRLPVPGWDGRGIVIAGLWLLSLRIALAVARGAR